MDLRAQRIQDSRYVDNESNDSGLSSETSQNSKERPTNIFDSRNLPSIRAVHFALDKQRKMPSQRSQSAITNERKSLKYATTPSAKDSKDLNSMKSKSNIHISPFMVKINPKSSPCCEYLMDDIKQLELPVSDNIEIGCDFSQYHQDMNLQSMTGMMDSCNQFDEQKLANEPSPCFDDHCSIIPNYQGPYQKTDHFSTFSRQASNDLDESNSESNFPSNYQSENCIYSILQSLDQSKDLLSSFRLLMSTRDTGFRLKTSNQAENSFSGLIVFDILRAENLQPPSISVSAPSLRLLQCLVKINSDCRIETSTEIFADKVIWDERFFVDLRECNFISILIYQSTEGCNKRLSHYGGFSLIELISDLQNQSQGWDQIILQMEPRGLLYIQLGLIPLYQSLGSQFCSSTAKNTHHSLLHIHRYSNYVPSLSDWIYVLRWCIAAADEKQRPMTLNIYKITVSEGKIIHLLKHIMNSRQNGNQLSIEVNIHSITSLIILGLREMCEPLISYEFSERFLIVTEQFFNVYDPNGHHLATEILVMLKTLPNQNQMAVLELFQHLNSVTQNGSKNKITCHYLSLLFAPLLFQTLDPAKYHEYQVHLMKSLLDNWSFIQDIKLFKVPTNCIKEKQSSKSMVSVAIQTEEKQKYHFSNFSSDNTNLEDGNSNKTLAYKSILKKPQSVTKKVDTTSNNDSNRTTFI